ncbi:TdeIII family type II restriction endonuclease [Nostoc spongiaeforme FACHB-130]|uniref:type II site-specific deoxyribonuclease n=1 Tax=Nostoc spongiaeforme FACHB-130 TaxID=1357510 RepID=A0ABR8G0Q9_9NOSO|nr:TdeIII family type II restriction endonuclease [Nostoc spongiaeforme]MBD2596819.1 TdeIII family type II restriction endonuclease [Nostoc spongiaeforme FACHB-130]
MDEYIKQKIKENLKKSIRAFFKNKEVKNYQVLDDIFPVERRIRSLIGGLETSLGTTCWEPIAKSLAELNGFEIITKKILRPEPFPLELQTEFNKLVHERENKTNNKRITTEECIQRLKEAALKTNPQDIIQYTSPPSGTGVDIHFYKNGIEYIFDIKTTQPNQANFKGFNRQLLEWYTYRYADDPHANLEARIAIPFNPFTKPWYEQQKSMLFNSPLDMNKDIWVENEFWNFCSGKENTFEQLKELFVELGQENFAEEFHDIFYQNQFNKNMNLMIYLIFFFRGTI